MMIKATSTDLNATLLMILRFASPTISRKTGVFPIGFNMAKKPKKTVLINNVKSGIVFIMSTKNFSSKPNYAKKLYIQQTRIFELFHSYLGISAVAYLYNKNFVLK